MGVIGLWNILENEVPVRLNTSNIKGETVAVDLATWICEAENVDLMKKTVPKPYLRYRYCNSWPILPCYY